MKTVYRHYYSNYTCIILFLCMSCSSVSCIFTGGIKNSDAYDREIQDLRKEIAKQSMEIEKLRDGFSRQTYTVLCTGDIMIANEAAHFIEKEGPDYPFIKIRDDLEKYDIVLANLETPVTSHDVANMQKPYILKMDPLNRTLLKQIHIDAVTLSNNHIMDYGNEGLADTIGYCREMGIKFTGAGLTLAEARTPAKVTPGITDVLILSYCERPPAEFYAGPDRSGTAPLVLESVIDDINRYKKVNNVVLVSLHWGIEQRQVPLESQREIAHAIIDAGADAVVGHHPHWPQGIEMYRARPIIYSLGNFISGFTNHTEKDNMLVSLQYERTRLTCIEVLPLAGKNRVIKYQPYLQKGKEAAATLKEIAKLCRDMGTSIEIVGWRGFIYP